MGQVLGFLGAVLFGTGLAGASTAYIIAVNVARIGLLALSAKIAAPKLDMSAGAYEKTLTIRDPVGPQSFVYGEDLISGPMFFSNTFGASNVNLTVGVLLTGHEIDSVTGYRLDDVDIALGDLSGAEDGNVTGTKFATVASVELRKGTSTQTAPTKLTTNHPASFDASATGRGWAYMVWEFNLVAGEEDRFANGAPQNIRAKVRGRKVYDPRKDSTNGGAGLHRLNDPTTWEWSNNPALCLADFIRDDKFGMREEDDRVNWPLVIAAADRCDGLVAVPTAQTQKRFTCNVTFQSTETRGAVRDELLGAMLGRMVFSQGKWCMWAGGALTATVDLTAANLAGSITVQANKPSTERYNRVRGKFIDASRDYTANNYPEQQSSAYLTEDGNEPRYLVSDFTSTQNTYEAQRKAIIQLKQSRNMRTLVFEGNWSCLRVQPGKVVTITIPELGFAGEKFFVTEWTFSERGVALTMVQETDTVWADPAEGDYTTRVKGTLVFGETGVPAVTGASVTATVEGARIAWTNPLSKTLGHVQVWRSVDNVRGNAVLIGTSPGESYLDISLNLSRRHFYWLRAVGPTGQFSAYTPDLTTTTLIAYPLQGNSNLLSDPDFDFSEAINNFDFNNRTVGDHAFHWCYEAVDRFDPSTPSSVTLLPTGGVNSSAAIKFVKGDPQTTPFTREVGLYAMRRVRANTYRYRIEVRYRNQGANAFDNCSFIVRGFSVAEAGTFVGAGLENGSGGLSFPVTGATWATLVTTTEVPTGNVQDARFWELGFRSFGAGSAQELEIDSIFMYELPAPMTGATGSADGKIGLVPVAFAGDQAKFLSGAGTWVAAATGGVDSFNGRTGAVVPVQADYDGFFLTPTEGNAAYQPIGTYVNTFNGRSGAVVPLQADYDGFFLTPAEGNAAYQPIGTYVNTFNGRSGTVVPLQADYDGFFLTPAEGNAAYAAIGHTHALDDLSDVDLAGAANNDLLFRSAGVWIDTAGNVTWNGSSFEIVSTGDQYKAWNTGKTGGAIFGYSSVGNKAIIKSATVGGIDLEVTAANARFIGTAFAVAANPTDADAIFISHDGVDANIFGVGTTDVNATSGFTAWNFPAITLVTALDETFGGTGLTSFSTGDLIYATAANTLGKRAAGAAGNVLTMSGGVPVWAAPGGASEELRQVTGNQNTQSSTYTDVTALTSFTLEANTWYTVEGFIEWNSDPTADIKFQWVFTNLPQDSFWTMWGPQVTGTAVGECNNMSNELTINPTVNNNYGHIVMGHIWSNATTGGTCKLQFAQQTTQALNTTIHRGSWIRIKKVG